MNCNINSQKASQVNKWPIFNLAKIQNPIIGKVQTNEFNFNTEFKLISSGISCWYLIEINLSNRGIFKNVRIGRTSLPINYVNIYLLPRGLNFQKAFLR